MCRVLYMMVNFGVAALSATASKWNHHRRQAYVRAGLNHLLHKTRDARWPNTNIIKQIRSTGDPPGVTGCDQGLDRNVAKLHYTGEQEKPKLFSRAPFETTFSTSLLQNKQHVRVGGRPI